MNKSQSKFKLWFDRFLSKSLWKQFALVFAFLVGALVVSYAILPIWSDNWQRVCEDNNINKWLLPIYLLIDSNALNNLYMNNVHGWALLTSSITFLLGAFIFNGFIIAIITNSIERRVSNHKHGHIHYLKSGHYIIMGYDGMVPSIISHVFERDKDAYVLLMSAAESEELHEKLKKVFNEKQLEHVIINYGHRASKEYYNDIHLETAEHIYIVGLRSKSSHDAINVECVDSICDYLEQPSITSRPKRITCVFEDLDTYAAFKTSEIFEKVGNLGIEFVPYNFYAGWAKQVFVKQHHTDKDRPGKIIPYPSVYGKDHTANDPKALTKDDDRYVHLVFVGTTNFAVAFAMEAAHVLHFPNGDKKKTRITFIDKNADREKDEFIVRNRHFFEIQSYLYCDLSENGYYKPAYDDVNLYFTKEKGYEAKDANFLDVEFEFIKGDVFSKNVQDVICHWAKEQNKNQYLSIFLAIANQRENFVLGMNMPDAVYDNEVPIFIRQDRSDNFVSNLREADEHTRTDAKKNTYWYLEDGKLESKVLGGRYSNIYPFGMNETAYCVDERSLRNAKLINYLYSTMPSSYQFQSLLALSAMSDEQIWKEANEYWKGLTVALKWSNLYNAYTISIKLNILRALRVLDQKDKSQDTRPLSNDEIEILARVEHNRWNVEKLLMGFRKAHKNEDKYGEDDDDTKSKLAQNKRRFIHHDIRPFDDLKDGIDNLDKEFSKYIPWIIKMTNK